MIYLLLTFFFLTIYTVDNNISDRIETFAADPSILIGLNINYLQQNERRSRSSLSTVEDLKDKTKIPEADPIVIDLITSPLLETRRRSVSLSPEFSNKRRRKNDELSFTVTSCSDFGKLTFFV